MSNVPMTFALTAREKEIVALVALGRSAKEIALELSLAPRTVEQHVARVILKTGTRNRCHMVVYAIRHHLIASSDVADPLAA
jgi:LuxR family transcriptional regulator, transcriptional regulator of spore coat protein